MSIPRVFISSTYYDLKQVRNVIGDFIKNIGYEPVRHEHSDVAYTQNTPLEKDCYSELRMKLIRQSKIKRRFIFLLLMMFMWKIELMFKIEILDVLNQHIRII